MDHNLNVKYKTIKLLEGNIGEDLGGLGLAMRNKTKRAINERNS